MHDNVTRGHTWKNTLQDLDNHFSYPQQYFADRYCNYFGKVVAAIPHLAQNVKFYTELVWLIILG